MSCAAVSASVRAEKALPSCKAERLAVQIFCIWYEALHVISSKAVSWRRFNCSDFAGHSWPGLRSLIQLAAVSVSVMTSGTAGSYSSQEALLTLLLQA